MLHTYKKAIWFYIKSLVLISCVISLSIFWYYNGNTMKPEVFVWIGWVLAIIMILNTFIRRLSIDTEKKQIHSKMVSYLPTKIYSFDEFVSFEIISLYSLFLYGGKSIGMVFKNERGEEKRILIDSGIYNTKKIQQIIEEISSMIWIDDPDIDKIDTRIL